MPTLYGCPNSRSLRAAWALEEAGADYDYVFVDLFKGAGRAADYLQINPGGKVPTLIVDGLPLTESGAILVWVAEHFPDAALLPPPSDAVARAEAWRWLCFCLTELDAALWNLAKHRFALPERLRVAAMEDTARWEFERAANLLALRLEASPCLAGEAFSVADILAAHCLAWARSAKLEIASPTLTDYLERNLARPAVARAMAREAAAKADAA